jgi:hypothetical protein
MVWARPVGVEATGGTDTAAAEAAGTMVLRPGVMAVVPEGVVTEGVDPAAAA